MEVFKANRIEPQAAAPKVRAIPGKVRSGFPSGMAAIDRLLPLPRFGEKRKCFYSGKRYLKCSISAPNSRSTRSRSPGL